MNPAKEFTIDLISNSSMEVFGENTMAKFRNQLSQPIILDGEWQVALSSISFPSNINNVNSNGLVVYKNSGVELDASNNRSGHLRKIRKGIYSSLDQLMDELRRIAQFKQFDFTFDKITHKMVLQFGANDCFSFENEEVPSILGFKGIKDNSHDGYIHIGYKSHKTLNRHQSDFPVDITCGSQLIFVYIDVIEYQIFGDVRAPVIKIIETERRLRNGSINTVTPIHHKTFTILDYKPILSNNIQNIKEELRNEAGKLIPFNGTGSDSRPKISKNQVKWKLTTATKHHSQCHISPVIIVKEEVALELSLLVLEELLYHWQEELYGPLPKELVESF